MLRNDLSHNNHITCTTDSVFKSITEVPGIKSFLWSHKTFQNVTIFLLLNSNRKNSLALKYFLKWNVHNYCIIHWFEDFKSFNSAYQKILSPLPTFCQSPPITWLSRKFEETSYFWCIKTYTTYLQTLHLDNKHMYIFSHLRLINLTQQIMNTF